MERNDGSFDMTTKKYDGGDAFPSPGVILRNGNQQGAYEGMSLRDYFAARAMQGLCVDAGRQTLEGIERNIPKAAAISYAMADAMIAERAK